MDIWLPGISEIEALAQLRTEPGTRDIPVIAVTASLAPVQRSAPPGTGVSSALDKERSAVLNDGPTTAWVAE
jgi:CheY-like chemotaxis protein